MISILLVDGLLFHLAENSGLFGFFRHKVLEIPIGQTGSRDCSFVRYLHTFHASQELVLGLC